MGNRYVEKYLKGTCPERAGFYDCDLPIGHDGPHRYSTWEKLDGTPMPRPTATVTTVTMAEIDEKRGQASELIERIRDMERPYPTDWSDPAAQIVKSLLPESKRMLKVLRDEINAALVQWSKQGFKEVGAPDDRFCGCGLYPHIQGHETLCYNTGNAVRDLHKVMDIPDTNSRRKVFVRWKGNYLKKCRATYDMSAWEPCQNDYIDAATDQCGKTLSKEVISAAEINIREPFAGETFGRRIEASVLVLTNKKGKP